MDNEDGPELAGYEPDDERPLRSPHLKTVMRVVVVLGLIALVLPGILVTMGTAARTAERSCAIYVALLAPRSFASEARLELFSPTGAGWNCYAIAFDGEELLVKSLGIIPGGVRLPNAPLGNT